MAKHLRIKPSDKMSDAINNNAQILMSMSRFGISLGFGEKCIKDVCDSTKCRLQYISGSGQFYI